MSRVIRKPDFCICKNKDPDQLRGNREADQRLCFRYIVQFLYFLNTEFQASSHLLSLYSQFVSDLVGNPEDRFSHSEAQMIQVIRHASGKQCHPRFAVYHPIFHISTRPHKYSVAASCLQKLHCAKTSIAIFLVSNCSEFLENVLGSLMDM